MEEKRDYSALRAEFMRKLRFEAYPISECSLCKAHLYVRFMDDKPVLDCRCNCGVNERWANFAPWEFERYMQPSWGHREGILAWIADTTWRAKLTCSNCTKRHSCRHEVGDKGRCSALEMEA